MVSLAGLESKAISIGLEGGYWARGERTDPDIGIGVYFELLFPYHDHRFRQYHRVGYNLEECFWYSPLLHFPHPSSNVLVFPRWVGRMQNLRRIHIQGGNIRFIPSTTVHHLRIKVTLPSQNPPLNVPGMKSLTEYTSIALKQYLDAGGDWTPLLDLPSHLLNNIIQAKLPKLQDDLDLDEFLKRRRMLTSFGLFQHPYVTELGD